MNEREQIASFVAAVIAGVLLVILISVVAVGLVLLWRTVL